MDQIKIWALRIVFSSVLISLVLVLTPGGSIEKPVKTAVSLFMLFIIVYPFLDLSNGISTFDLTDIQTESALIKSDRIIADQLEYELSEKIKKKLYENQLSVDDVMVEVGIYNENELKVECVKVLVQNDNKSFSKKILQVLKDNFEINAEIEVVNEQLD